MNEKDFAELAAGHALSALTPEDEALFADALARHPEWEAIVHSDAATVLALADAVEPVEAPADIRASLLAAIATTPQLPADAPEPTQAHAPAHTPAPIAHATRASNARAAKKPRRRVWFALAASLALLVAVGAGTVAIVTQMTTPVAVTALERIEAAPDAQSAETGTGDGPSATLHWSESVGEAVLVSEGLPTLADDQAFELWFVRDGQPISAGIFDADGDAATALLDGALQAGDVIAVTVEPDGGSPTGAPTSDPIIAITTA